jgi:hypothetical protein
MQPNVAIPARLTEILDRLITDWVYPVAAAEVLAHPVLEQARAVEVLGLHTVRMVLSDKGNPSAAFEWSLRVFLILHMFITECTSAPCATTLLPGAKAHSSRSGCLLAYFGLLNWLLPFQGLVLP